MTVLQDTRTAVEIVTLDLYRDIHKGIRAELFALTGDAGRLDPADRVGRVATQAYVDDVVALLVSHAEHEDGAVQPAIEANLPDLAVQVVEEHEGLEARMVDLQTYAADAVAAGDADARGAVHRLYVELASFTSAYLAHQDLEERVVMPRLEAAIGFEAVLGIHQAIVGSIPPEEMAKTLPGMLRAMNVDDRTELVGGMQAGAPPEVFAGLWSLVKSGLTVEDAAPVAARLGLDLD
jgi:hypothetical protein